MGKQTPENSLDNLPDIATYLGVVLGLFFAYHLITKPIHTLKEIFIGIPLDLFNHNYKLWLEFFGHNIKLQLPYYLETDDKPERIEQKTTLRSVLSALWWLIVVSAWLLVFWFFLFL